MSTQEIFLGYFDAGQITMVTYSKLRSWGWEPCEIQSKSTNNRRDRGSLWHLVRPQRTFRLQRVPAKPVAVNDVETCGDDQQRTEYGKSVWDFAEK